MTSWSGYLPRFLVHDFLIEPLLFLSSVLSLFLLAQHRHHFLCCQKLKCNEAIFFFVARHYKFNEAIFLCLGHKLRFNGCMYLSRRNTEVKRTEVLIEAAPQNIRSADYRSAGYQRRNMLFKQVQSPLSTPPLG